MNETFLIIALFIRIIAVSSFGFDTLIHPNHWTTQIIQYRKSTIYTGNYSNP